MLSIAHGTTGALIATLIPNPLISVPLILAAHFIEDYVPHWDVGTGLTKKIKSKRGAFIQELLIDFPLSIILVYFIFQHNQPFSYLPWFGWFICLLPDFIEFPYIFFKWRFTPLNQFARLHSFFHRSTTDVVRGLLPQFAVILLSILLK